jgi:flagellar hook assembly protein FlgD
MPLDLPNGPLTPPAPPKDQYQTMEASPAAQDFFKKILEQTGSGNPRVFADTIKNGRLDQGEATFEVKGNSINAFVPDGVSSLRVSYNNASGVYNTGKNGIGASSAAAFEGKVAGLNRANLLPIDDRTNPNGR